MRTNRVTRAGLGVLITGLCLTAARQQVEAQGEPPSPGGSNGLTVMVPVGDEGPLELDGWQDQVSILRGAELQELATPEILAGCWGEARRAPEDDLIAFTHRARTAIGETECTDSHCPYLHTRPTGLVSGLPDSLRGEFLVLDYALRLCIVCRGATDYVVPDSTDPTLRPDEPDPTGPNPQPPDATCNAGDRILFEIFTDRAGGA